MYTHKTKSKGIGARTNHPFQSDNNRSAIQFTDKRPIRAAQNALQLAMNSGQGVIQMDKDISDTVFYGYGEARQPFLARDRSVDQSMPHQTVDTLNEAIGLTNEAMVGPMGTKRATVKGVLNHPQGGLSRDERAWIVWLQRNKKALLMPSMTGKQCREDMKMDDSWWATFTKKIIPPKKHNIKGLNNITWKQESHDVNVVKNRQQQDYGWNINRRIAHNNYVNGMSADDNALTVDLENSFADANIVDYIIESTLIWLDGDVMHRFWRHTSLMGLDFFVARNKNVAFIREQGQDNVIVNGRNPITDSEWMHATNQNYVLNGHVERVTPIANQQPNQPNI